MRLYSFLLSYINWESLSIKFFFRLTIYFKKI
nr:MAG TPA: hypothetical protein [Caudoviricetes sp.]